MAPDLGHGQRAAAIVPAFNEEQRIEKTVRALLGTGQLDEVIVVDDGSTDSTPMRAGQAGATVVRLASNSGKSVALDAGVRHSTQSLLLLVDADLGETASDTVRLLWPVQRDRADMTIASWPATTGGGFGLAKGLAGWYIRRMTGAVMNSPLSGQRAIRRQVWDCWRGSTGFGFEMAFTVDALRAGHRVAEVPLSLAHREHGRTWRGFIHRGKQAWHLLLTMWRRGWGR